MGVPPQRGILFLLPARRLGTARWDPGGHAAERDPRRRPPVAVSRPLRDASGDRAHVDAALPAVRVRADDPEGVRRVHAAVLPHRPDAIGEIPSEARPLTPSRASYTRTRRR